MKFSNLSQNSEDLPDVETRFWSLKIGIIVANIFAFLYSYIVTQFFNKTSYSAIVELFTIYSAAMVARYIKTKQKIDLLVSIFLILVTLLFMSFDLKIL